MVRDVVGALLLVVAAAHSSLVELGGLVEHGSLVEYINSAQTTWTAKENEITARGVAYMNTLMGFRPSAEGLSTPRTSPDYGDEEILGAGLPESFDAREKWPHCRSIASIKDQSDCGSCWAVAAAESISDRLCIATKGHTSVNISAQHITSCCKGHGCEGGDPMDAFNFYLHAGIVTGGDYESSEGCQPYQIAPCGSGLPACPSEAPPTPPCHKKACYNHVYRRSFRKDLHKAKTVHLLNKDETAIKKEIFKNGPVEAGFDVYADFMTYSKGVYSHTAGSYLGGHAVKVLGWGKERDTPYWLAANSWRSNWGDGGYFKILRGADECGFESYITTGIPRTRK